MEMRVTLLFYITAILCPLPTKRNQKKDNVLVPICWLPKPFFKNAFWRVLDLWQNQDIRVGKKCCSCQQYMWFQWYEHYLQSMILGKSKTKSEQAHFLNQFLGIVGHLSPLKGFSDLLFFYHGHMSLVKRLASGTRFNQDLVIGFFFPVIRNIFM